MADKEPTVRRMLTSLAGWAALVVVIAFGVALGIILALAVLP